jgi:hypothetical protein
MALRSRVAAGRDESLSLPRLPLSSSYAAAKSERPHSTSTHHQFSSSKYSTISTTPGGSRFDMPRPASLLSTANFQRGEPPSSSSVALSKQKQLQHLAHSPSTSASRVPASSSSSSSFSAVDTKPDKGSSSSSSSSSSAEKKGAPTTTTTTPCDKCDGKHATEKCPWFHGKPRENHPDAKKGNTPSIGSSSVKETLRKGRIVQQPPDGSCLYHSLCYGLQEAACSASRLRSQIATFVQNNPDLPISDTPLQDWVS